MALAQPPKTPRASPVAALAQREVVGEHRHAGLGQAWHVRAASGRAGGEDAVLDQEDGHRPAPLVERGRRVGDEPGVG